MSSATVWECRADDLGKKVSSQHSHPNTSFELKWNVPSVMLRRGNDPQLTGSVLQGALHNPLWLTIGKRTREAAVESGKGRHLGSFGCSSCFPTKDGEDQGQVSVKLTCSWGPAAEGESKDGSRKRLIMGEKILMHNKGMGREMVKRRVEEVTKPGGLLGDLPLMLTTEQRGSLNKDTQVTWVPIHERSPLLLLKVVASEDACFSLSHAHWPRSSQSPPGSTLTFREELTVYLFMPCLFPKWI